MDRREGCGCVVLAAGQGRRFGGDKLLAPFRGRPLIRWALDAVPTGETDRCAVVSGEEEVLRMAEEHGFLPVKNEAPELGVSHSLRLGLEALGECRWAAFLVADQPGLRRETVARAIRAAREAPDRIVALAWRGRQGNPRVFPAEFFPELMELTGDRGGSAVAARHPSRLLLVETEREELADVDDRAALAALDELPPLRIERLYPQLTVRFFGQGKCFGPGIGELIGRVGELGSLRAAAQSLDMSYSKAWTIVRQCEEALGWPLLVRRSGGKHGGGATLTADARQLLELYGEFWRELDEFADRLLEEKLRERFTDPGGVRR